MKEVSLLDKKQYSEEIKKFYTEQTVVWPENDKWHMHTHCYINDYVSDKINSIYKKNMKILNAGSGGNTYGLTQEMYHIDVADNKIKHFPLYSKASIEDIPYNNEFFDICICVGTVINYTNASRSMDEFYRVLKPGGSLVLEFENSGNPEFRKYPCDEAGKKFVTSKYFNHDHSYWAYSPEYINSILYAHDMRIADIHYFHILSALIYSFTYNENFSVKFSGTDRFLEHFDFAKKHSANVILTAVKGDKQNEKHS